MRNEDRMRDIVGRRERGESLYTIAAAHGLTHSRISQILKSAGAPVRPRSVPLTDGISPYAIRQIWCRLTAAPVEVWICPAGGLVQLKIVTVEPWVEGALQVGTYTSAVVLSDFADDVHAALAEFRRNHGGA